MKNLYLRPSGEIYHRKGVWKHLPLWLFKLSMKFRKPDEVHEYKQPEFTVTMTEHEGHPVNFDLNLWKSINSAFSHSSFSSEFTVNNDLQIYFYKSKMWKYIPEWLYDIIYKFKKPDRVFRKVKPLSISLGGSKNQ